MIKETEKITLLFDAPTHIYSDAKGRVYTSATTVIGKYKKPFDKRYWGMYTALKDKGIKVRPNKGCTEIFVNGVPTTLGQLYGNPTYAWEVTMLFEKWDRLTEEACARGNEIHDYLEDSINLSKGDIAGDSNEVIKPQLGAASNGEDFVTIATKHDLDKTTIESRFPIVYFKLLSYINQGCTIFAEKKIYSSVYLIAGMIDVLIVKGKQFAILDWKTNKDVMHFHSGYYKKIKRGEVWIKSDNFIKTDNTLLKPLEHIAECKGMVYSMQLSLYAYIMEMWGYTLVPNGLMICHMRPGLDPKMVAIRYLREEVEAMLNHHSGKEVKAIKQGTQFGIFR